VTAKFWIAYSKDAKMIKRILKNQTANYND